MPEVKAILPVKLFAEEDTNHSTAVKHLGYNRRNSRAIKAHMRHTALAEDEQVIKQYIHYRCYHRAIDEQLGAPNGDKERAKQLRQHQERQPPHPDIHERHTQPEVLITIQRIPKQQRCQPQRDHHQTQREEHRQHSAIGQHLCQPFLVALTCAAGHLYLHAAAQAITDHRQYQVKHARNAIHPKLPRAQPAQEHSICKKIELRYQQRQRYRRRQLNDLFIRGSYS